MSIDRRPLVRWLDYPAMRRTRTRTGEPLGKISLPSYPESARAARCFVQVVAEAYGITHAGDTATLLVSELATNAIKHAGNESNPLFHVAVSRVVDRMRVEVHDSAPRLPEIRTFDAFDEDGRGLYLVQELADDHGAYLLPRGKSIWFELRAWYNIADTWGNREGRRQR